MNKKILIVFIAVIFCTVLTAQDTALQNIWSRLPLDNEAFVNRAKLTPHEVEQIKAITKETEKIRREAKAELDFYKAQLNKLMIKDSVNLNEVEKVLNDSLEWKLKMEFSSIKQFVTIKELLGAERLETISASIREAAKKRAVQQNQDNARKSQQKRQ